MRRLNFISVFFAAFLLAAIVSCGGGGSGASTPPVSADKAQETVFSQLGAFPISAVFDENNNLFLAYGSNIYKSKFEGDVLAKGFNRLWSINYNPELREFYAAESSKQASIIFWTINADTGAVSYSKELDNTIRSAIRYKKGVNDFYFIAGYTYGNLYRRQGTSVSARKDIISAGTSGQLALDQAHDRLYYATGSKIYRYEILDGTDGTSHAIAGSGVDGTADSLSPMLAEFGTSISGLAFDNQGNLVVADATHKNIRKVVLDASGDAGEVSTLVKPIQSLANYELRQIAIDKSDNTIYLTSQEEATGGYISEQQGGRLDKFKLSAQPK